MRYNIGDKVIIKKDPSLHWAAQERLNKHNWVLTIKSIESSPLGAAFPYYVVEEMGWHWNDSHIKGLCNRVKVRCGKKEPEPVRNRFEILDL